MATLIQRVGIKYPIIQAPMAGVSTPALAAAVSNAGALGSIGVGPSPVASVRTQIQELKTATKEPYNVNVFTHAEPTPDPERDAKWLAYVKPQFEQLGKPAPEEIGEPYPSFNSSPDVLEILLEEKVPVVSFHFGLPSKEAVAKLKAAGTYLLASATSVSEAQAVADAGIDAVVAQGYEAGGHRGVFDETAHDDQLSTLDLVAALSKAVSIPIIAAGGIMNGTDAKAALSAGASAVQLGTAFIPCPESAADAAYTPALLGAPGANTRIVDFISGRPARALAGGWTALADDKDRPQAASYPGCYNVGKKLQDASGKGLFGVRWAGTGANRARPMGAAELVGVLVEEMGL